MIINWQKAAGYQLTFVANVDQVSAELLRAGSNHIDLLFNWCLKKKEREKRSEIQRERKRERIDWGGVGVATFYPRFYSDLSRQQKKRRKKAKREDF